MLDPCALTLGSCLDHHCKASMQHVAASCNRSKAIRVPMREKREEGSGGGVSVLSDEGEGEGRRKRSISQGGIEILRSTLSSACSTATLIRPPWLSSPWSGPWSPALALSYLIVSSLRRLQREEDLEPSRDRPCTSFSSSAPDPAPPVP